MKDLYLAELRRVTSRRFFQVLGVVLVGILLIQAGFAFFDSSKDPNSGLERAREVVASCEQEREAARQRGEFIDGDLIWQCPTLEEIRGQFDDRFLYARTMGDVFQGVGVFFLALGLLVGASAVGAEWGTGSMTVLLTWEPRRGRVLLAKWLATMTVVLVALVALLAAIAIIFLPIAVLRGTTEGATRSFWWTQMGLGVRDLGLGVFGVTGGVALATVLRSSAGAIGLGFTYGVIGDFMLGVWRDGVLEEWLLRYNIQRLLGLPVEVERGFGEFEAVTMTAVRPAVLLATYAVAMLAVAYAVFRRRDVT